MPVTMRTLIFIRQGVHTPNAPDRERHRHHYA